MALVVGVNSYVDVETADLYFTDRLDAAAWTDADETLKGQALVTATSVLDDMKWAGAMDDAEQALAWPRTGYYFDPRAGGQQSLDGVLASARLAKACEELAYHLLNNDGLLDDTGGVDTLSLGGLELKGVVDASEVPDTVHRLVKPLLLNSGVNSSWWRNN